MKLNKDSKKASERNRNGKRNHLSELELFIGMENEFPNNPKELAEIYKSIQDSEQRWFEATNIINDYLSNAPNCLAFVRAASPISDTLIPDTPRLYESLRKSIIKLRYLASNSIYHPFVLEKLSGEVFFNVNEEGIINFSGEDLFTQIMQNIPANRIRSCEICGNVFWAKKIGEEFGSKACSKEHAANLRNRKSYEKNKENRIKNREELNKRRRDIYAYKQKVKKRKGKNGNL